MADLVIRISGDIKNYEEALDKASKETEGLSDSLSSVAQKSAIAFAALTAEIGFAVAAYKESEQVVNQLNQSLQNQGIYTKELSDEYQRQATVLQSVTGLSDEAIISAQTSIQAYLGQTEVTQDLTNAIADLATAKGMDLQSTAELIGKGINGQTAALKKAGIAIDENASKQERLGQVIEKISGLYGGQAEAAAKGLGGLNILKEAFGNLQEVIGERFAPAISRVALTMAKFINSIANNKPLVEFISYALGAAAAITGIVAITAAAGTGFLALRAAMLAANIQIGLTTVAIRVLLGATALGLLITGLVYVALNWEKTWAYASAIFTGFVTYIKETAGGVVQILTGIFSGDLNAVKEGGKKLKEAFGKGWNETKVQFAAFDEAQKQSEEKQSEAQKKASDARKAEADRQDRLMVASRKAASQALILESQRASQEQIKLKQEESALLKQLADEDNIANRAAIQRKLEDNRTLQNAANANAVEESKVFQEQALAQNEEFQSMSEAQQQEFLLRNQQAIQSSVDTEKEIQMRAAEEKAAIQVKEHNVFLDNQRKFGTAYAMINQIMNSTIVQGSAKAFGELAALQSSSNATLKSIGKFAAASQIAIKTAESAMNIYAGFSTIPIVGPSLGIAGALAAGAFGAEQISKVNAAADGGLLEGGIPGVDSIPVLAQQGELITPRRNFDEVVDAVASQRASELVGQPQQAQSSGPIEIILSLKDELMDFVEAQLTERDALGISLRVSGS